jgi:2-(1,2-epoxy-1,2-dihydrophenyl)acetyl-CoA isomerase
MASILIETQKGVRTIKLNRPDRLNAVNDELSTQLEHAIQQASSDDEVRVVVITGEGRGFCAGLDLSDLQSRTALLQQGRVQLDELGWVGRLALGIFHNDKPTIAAINGIAAGAGLALTLACDLRYMAQGAKATTGYIRRGLNPDAGMTYFLPRLIGLAKAAELIYTGKDILPEEAERIGLVNGVFTDEEFMPKVMDIAYQLAQGPPIAMTLSKRLLAASAESDLSTLLKRELASIKLCFGTKDVQEGIRAFSEKRKPIFRGE